MEEEMRKPECEIVMYKTEIVEMENSLGLPNKNLDSLTEDELNLYGQSILIEFINNIDENVIIDTECTKTKDRITSILNVPVDDSDFTIGDEIVMYENELELNNEKNLDEMSTDEIIEYREELKELLKEKK